MAGEPTTEHVTFVLRSLERMVGSHWSKATQREWLQTVVRDDLDQLEAAAHREGWDAALVAIREAVEGLRKQVPDDETDPELLAAAETLDQVLAVLARLAEGPRT